MVPIDLEELGYDLSRLEELDDGKEGLEDLTQAYISRMTGTDPKEVEEVWGREGTVYEGLREHERSEVAAHLLDDYSEEEILNGTAKEENHDRAHEAALLSEHSFYQDLGKKLTGKEIPLKALMLLHPLNMTGEVLRDGGRLKGLQQTKEKVEAEDVTGTELFYALRVFENPDKELEYYDYNQVFGLAQAYLDNVTEEEFGEFEERRLMDIELPWGV